MPTPPRPFTLVLLFVAALIGCAARTAPAAPPVTVGTPGSYQNLGNTIAKATDGDLATFFDAPTANGGWVGVDLGSLQTITSVSVAPRPRWGFRMVGGWIEGSPDATWANVIGLARVTAVPPDGKLTVIPIPVGVAPVRFVRYRGPDASFCDIGEFSVASVPVQPPPVVVGPVVLPPPVVPVLPTTPGTPPATPPAGWTVLTPSATCQRVYVDSVGGNDANAGTSTAAPVKTLQRGYNLVRAGTDDQLLLLRGDTWHEAFPQWRKGGVDAAHPVYVGAYGAGPRPLLLTGTSSGFSLTGGPPIAHLMLRDVRFEADARNPARGAVTAANAAISPTGFISTIGGTDLHIEGCSFDYYGCGILVQTTAQVQHDVTVRRCSTSNGYAIGWSGHPQGIFAAAVQGLVIDQCVVDHGGWLAGNPATLSGYNHGMYLQDENTGVSVLGCLVAHSSFNGIMARCGGVIDSNLVTDGCGGIIFGAANGATATLGGVSGRVTNNVVMFDHSLPTTPYGVGIEVGNTAPAAHVAVSSNLVWGDTQHTGQGGISLIAAVDAKSPGVGINNLTVGDNDVGWDCGITLDGHLVPGGSGVTGLNGLTVAGNRFTAAKHAAYHPQAMVATAGESWSGNTYAVPATLAKPFVLGGADLDPAGWQKAVEPSAVMAAVQYVDPTRTPDAYARSIGLADLDALVAAAAAQCDTTAAWDDRYTAAAAARWIKAGFTPPVPVPSAAK